MFLSIAVCSTLCRNMAHTYSKFPSLQAPPLAVPVVELPPGSSILGAMVAAGGWLLVGPLAVALVRPRDWWGDLSAGLTSGLVAAGTSYVLGLGWASTLATTIVPSIADITFVTGPNVTPDLVAERYPDLVTVEADKRGGVLMGKIIADQMSGGATGVWFGAAMALLTAGLTAVGGAITAGYLRRRGDALRPAAWAYVGMTIPSVVTVVLCVASVLGPVAESLLGAIFGVPFLLAAGLVGFAVVNAVGAVRRQPTMLRAAALLGWFALLVQTLRPDTPWQITLAAVVLAGGFLIARAALPALPAQTAGAIPAAA